MAQTEAQRRSSRKWKEAHLKNVTVSMRKEFVEELDAYLNSAEGQKYGSRSTMIKTLLLEQMKRDGFEPNSRP